MRSVATVAAAFFVVRVLPAEAASPPPFDVRVPVDNAQFSFTGRFDFSDPARPAFQWPMTAVGTRARCEGSARVVLRFQGHDAYTRLNAYLRGEKVASTFSPSGQVATLSVPLPRGASDLVIEKDSEDVGPDPAIPNPIHREVWKKPVYFLGAALQGSCTLRPLPPKQRRIEVIGDSISCGFGSVAGESKSCNEELVKDRFLLYNVSTAHGSYASQLARLFDAELHLECISGIGMCKNGNDFLERSSPRNMSFYVDRTLPYRPGPPVQWDYTQWQPDVLLINLGTNDYHASIGPTAPAEDVFEAHYVAFVVHLMRRYDRRKTKVVLACGPMTNVQCPSVTRVVSTLSSNGIVAAYVDANLPDSPAKLHGCIMHPSLEEHTATMKLVAPVIASLTGWGADSRRPATILV